MTDEIVFKQILADAMEAVSEAIKTQDPEVTMGFAKNLRNEIEYELNHTRLVQSRKIAKTVTELRSISGSGLFSCKQALEESEWDINAALELLRERGL